MGLIAQEVAAVVPECVSIAETDGMMSVAYGNMIGVLVEAIKELQVNVQDLYARKRYCGCAEKESTVHPL